MQIRQLIKAVPIWLPGLLVISGGLYTSIRYHLLFQEMLEMRDNAGNALLEALYSIPLLFSGGLFLPILIGLILTIIGFVMLWKPNSSLLPFVTMCLSILLLNWIGILISFTGSLIGAIIVTQKEKN